MKQYDNFKDLKVTQEENLLWISLDNPKMSNAITDDMINSIEEVLNIAGRDNSVRCVILFGEGKTFCAGGDLKAMGNKSGMFSGEPNELRENYQNGIQRIPLAMEKFHKPIIAMVNGAAIGAGCDLACMCDLRIGCEYSAFGETFNNLALVPGDGGTFFVPRVVGYAKAMEMFLTCDIYKGEKAKDFGLLNFYFNSSELKEKTKELAQKISSHSPIATQMTKRSLKHYKNSELSAMLDLLSAYQGITQRSQDHFAALEAFKNKTQADFKHS